MPHIAGVFDSKAEANAAITKLLNTGFNKEDLSLIVSDNAYHTIFPHAVDNEEQRTVYGLAEGVIIGGALGALVAGLTLVGAVAIPGGVLVAGPLVAILTGAASGSAVGGLSGALISAGFAVDEAKHYENEIRHGKAVIVVNSTKEMAKAAEVALHNSNAEVRVA